ncbi:proline--tRNA ligase [Propionimicrobium lymphophilum]|uniref:proline--tRNA ligase n=1 Tax=Propionimicrobium lymphophilum TaxID=33012 RepID=UPI00254A7632|nr:proline--tRNA ligase [Propionimicrobium lymphophilum]MDK7709758.1 proline--tRNA ligase [Propionimicrobium lymphophilum]MDK7733980.1 proline--tRNA ligase [Propionimicrobium lymphophilum]
MSELFVRTLRDDPADAELPSHKLLVRAGYIRRTAPGIYTWLPLGLKVLRKIEEIVRVEMDRIGAQEVLFPALLPSEPYVATNRWTEYGDNLFRLKDRRGTDMLLGPTHEEMFTLLVKDMYRSYKDLPLALYQIQTKYRDEARPRAGVLRGREFVMKDSYSFDVDDAGLDASYAKHREAYIRIFDQLGFDYAIVKADAGPMGGSKSEEFLAVSPNGEDTFVRSPGGFAANVEAVRFPVAEPVDCSSVPAAQVVDTPNVPTIDSLVELSNSLQPRSDREWAASDMLKSIVFMLSYPDGERVPLVVGLPGDREVDEKRLEAAVSPAEVEPFTAEDFEKYPQLVKGYIGPLRDGKQFLGEEAPAKVRYLVDPRVAEGSEWVSGANENERHAYHLVFGRDFTADGRIDVAEVREGDPSPDGSGPLTLARGIEMGHIFQLGRKYADALGLQVLDQNGKLVTVTMGSYGIGVSRAVAAIVEDTYDEKGLSWPRSIAPYDVMVLATGKGDEVAKKAKEIAEQLAEEGFEVLLDDRKASPGVKFKDSELIGVPTSVVIGKLLAEGKAEIRDRASGEVQIVPVDEAIEAVKKLAE